MIVSVIGCPNSGPATKVLTLPTSHQDRAVTPPGCVMSRLSASGPHRASLWRRLRPRENAATLLRGARACLALLAAAALLALAAPAQAQTEVWTATLTPADLSSGILGCSNNVTTARCSDTTFLSEDSFNHDSTDYNITGLFVRSSGRFEFLVDADLTTATAALTLVVGSTSFVLADANIITARKRVWFNTGLSLTAGTDITVKLTAPGTANTPPTAADNTVTTGEDRAYTFTADDFGFVDTDAGDTLASVKIVTVPALGTLALDGTAVTVDDVVTKAQIDGDMLIFTPARDAHGVAYTTFTFKVNDGTDDSASAYTMTIDVTDAPAPVCTAPSYGDRREIWTGTVTAEEFSFLGSVTGYGFDEVLPAGTLLPSQSFFIGSNNYVIDAITVSLSGSLHFSLDGFSFLTATETAALRLHVCDGDYDFSTADDRHQNTTVWLATSLDWSHPVVTRTVYLSLPANNAATGEPAITGTAQVGQELTADASPIADDDGLPSSFTYKWFRVDSDGTSNEEDITGEIAATYTLTDDDEDKKIKVKVSFTDELSGEEERTSAAYPSSGTVTAAGTNTAPALLSVTVTSTPHKTTDTYGAREHIEFSMTFDAPVTVTGAPTFAFDLGGATTATWYAGSGTATLRFSHAVTGGSSGDRDTNGISWAANAIALNGGTIAGTDNAVAAILTHVAQSNLAGHKVDGRTTAVTAATVTDVEVTSTPMLMASGSSTADTYGLGETIVITVTVSEAVEVEGDPEFEFSLTDLGGAANDVPATYDGTRSSATTMAFTYTVQAGDRDNNGIWIGDHSRTFMLDANDRIRTASQKIDIDRSHLAKGTHAGHKVDGSLTPPATVPPDPTPPTLVLATATTLTVEWTHPGDGGSPLVRNYVHYRVEGATDWTNWYVGETPVTRAVIRNLEAETAYDVRVHSTNAIGNSQWVQSATAFRTRANTPATGAPSITGTATVGQDLTASTTGIDDDDGLPSSFTYQWVRVDADGTSNPVDITDATAATYTLTADDEGKKVKVKVSFTDDLDSTETLTSAAYPSSGTVGMATTSTAPFTAAWAADAYTADEGESVTVTATLHTAADEPKPSESYLIRVITEGNSATAGADYTPVTTNLTVTPSVWEVDDAMFTATVAVTVETVEDSVLEGDERFYVILTGAIGEAQPGLECTDEFRNLGSASGCATVVTIADDETLSVTEVTVSSTPAAGETYLAGEAIEFTVGFTASVTVTGTPTFAFTLGSAVRQATYASGSETAALVFSYTVLAGDLDRDGISWEADALALAGGTIRLTTDDANIMVDATLAHAEEGPQTGHKVDGGAPTVPPDPTPPTLVLATATTLTIEWTHPGDGGSPLTRNFIEYRVEGTTVWTNWYRGDTPTTVTRTVIRNLAAATAYDVRVHSTNAIGNSQWTQSASAFSTLANNAATGAPSITGTATVGQELTASTTGIDDDDGLPSSFTYQWVRVDADGTSNPVDITDATAATYTLTADDEGKKVKVKVSFTDDLDSTETRTSAAYPSSGTVTAAAGTNTAPTAADNTVTTGEDRAYTFEADDFGFVDTDSGDTLASVKIVTVPTPGTLALNGTAVLANAVVTKAQIDGNMLTFTPVAGASGAPYTTFTFKVNDGTDDSASAYTMTIDVTAAGTNTAPTAANNTVTTAEDTVYTFEADDFRFMDADPGDTLAIVKIWSSQWRGTLALDGVAINWYAVVTKAQIDGKMLTFTPARDAHRDHYGSFRFKVNDGTDDSTFYGMRIDVTDTPAPVCGVPSFGDRRNIWTGTVTVGTYRFGGSPLDFYGYKSSAPPSGDLDDQTFTIGSNDYTIVLARVALGGSNSGELLFEMETGQKLTTVEVAALRLHVCDTTVYNFSDATNSRLNSYGWSGSLDWSHPVVTRTVYLSLPANNAATGEPAITGTATVGQELTATTGTIADDDGLPSSFTYQWVRVDADGTSNPADITDANAATYTLTDDAGKKIKVKVSFTDELSGVEMRTSAAYPSSGTVTAAAGTPTGAPTITGTAQVGETLTAVTTGIADADGLTSPTYTYQWIRVNGTDADISGANSSTYPLVTADLGKTIKVRVTFDDDDGNTEMLTSASYPSSGTVTMDVTLPSLSSATVQGMVLTLVYDEPLDENSTPAPRVYILTVKATVGTTTTNTTTYPAAVSVSGNRVRLTLDTAPAAGARVTLLYLVFVVNPVQDVAGNDALPFGVHVMRGNPPPPTNTPPVVANPLADQEVTVDVPFTYVVPADAFTDADGNPLTYTAALSDGGMLPSWLTFDPATRTFTGTPAPGDGGTVRVTVTASDGTATVSDEFALMVTVGNTAPTAVHNTVTTAEDMAYTFTADDFGFMDDDAGAALASVKIVTVPALGILALDGTAVLVDAVVTKAQIDGDMLTFTPARDAHGAPYTTFTFKVNDGTDDSASAYTMTIDVTDAPAPVCTAPSFGDRRQIWTSTVMVEAVTTLGVPVGVGELALKEFDIGSNNYTIDAIGVSASGVGTFGAGGLFFSVDSSVVDSLTATETAALRLHVCDGDYDFSTAIHRLGDMATFHWTTANLDWSPPVVTRTLYLSLPANNVATDEPAITGTAQVGQELTADASPIMDTDGLTDVDFTYQWLRVDEDGTSNEEDITDAIAETYTLATDDVGKKVKVKVSFTDELSGEEERTSAAYPSSGTVTTAGTNTAPMVTDVDVTSMPASGDTYGIGEMIRVTVTFDQNVTVVGTPEFEFCLGSSSTMSCSAGMPPPALRSAAYVSGSGTTMLVFSYTVVAGDMDDNGIWIGDQADTLKLDAADTIEGTMGGLTAVLTHAEEGPQTGHKVDGGAPTVPPDPTPPTLVLATATTLTIEWTHPDDGGSPLTRNFIEYRVEGTTVWTNWYRGETPTPVTRTVIRNLAAATAYDVRVHSTNAIGNSQWVQSATAFSTLANTPATGAPSITGTAQVGQELTASTTGIDDDDGLPSSFTYQWVRVDADGTSNPVDITDATAETYTLTDDDAGKKIKVKVSFTDDLDSTETLTSAGYPSSGTVMGTNTAPTAADNTVTTGEDRAYTFEADDFGFVDTDAGDTLASVRIVTLPGAGALTLDGAAVTTDQVIPTADIAASKLIFTPAAGASGDAYASFTFKVSDGTAESATAYTMTVNVRPAMDLDPPGLESAKVDDDTLTLTYDEALDEGSVPAASAFSVSLAGGAGEAPSAVSVDGDTVTLTLATAAAVGQTVTVSYTVPTSNPVQDVAGNNAPAFADRSVTMSALRLMGGKVAHEGRLEIRYDGQWGTICDDYWTDVEADVACRALGYPKGSVEGGGSRFDRAHFGPGSGSILLDDVNCVGNETSLLECDYRKKNGVKTVGYNNCTHREDVGVRCQLAARARVAQVPEVSPSGSDGWTSGETLTVTLTFSEAVTVDTNDGTPSLEVVLGTNTERQAEYASGSGSQELVFTYEMVAADGTHTAVQVPANSLRTNGGRIYATSTEHDAALGHEAASLRATVSPPPANALTARFEKMPASHKGPGSRFSFELHFSAEPAHLSYRSVAGPLFMVTNGAVTGARQLTATDNSGWQVDVEPSRYADVTVTLRATTACNAAHAVCTAANGRLLQGISATVSPSLPALSVFDAEVQEGSGARLDFEVRLSPAADVRVGVYYETADGTARAGRYPDGSISYRARRDCEAGRHNDDNGDYLPASGLLLFEAGETVKTVSVAVCDDAHDEGSETMYLRLTGLALVEGLDVSSYIADGTATGTITNDDPMPGAWLARFGRTVGSHVLEAVSARVDGRPNSHLTVGGVSLGGNTPLDAAAPLAPRDRLAEHLTQGPDARRPEERTLSGHQLLLGSSFHLVSQAEAGSAPAFSAWGRVSTGGFRAEVDDLTMDGDVTTGLLGFDAEWKQLLAGLVLAHSEGDGGYNLSGGERGSIESSLNGIYPYARLRLNDRVLLWGLAGAGSGDLTLVWGDEAIDTGLGMRLGAIGVRGTLPAGRGFDLAVKSDALWVRTDSDAAAGLAAATVQVSRLRLILEARRTFALASGAVLAPTAQVGLRHDGGDAETGTGVEVGAGIRYTAGMLTIEGQVRTLLAHEAGGYEEWGASGAIRLSPDASGLGPSLALLPAWGASGSAMARLWSHPEASALVQGSTAAPAPGRLDAEFGWGLPALRGRGVLTPYARVALAQGDNQSWHLGARLALAKSLNLSLEGSRRRTGRDTVHDLTLRASMPW